MVEFFVFTQGFGSQLPELVRAPDNINFFGFSHAILHSPFSFDKLLIGAAFLTRAIVLHVAVQLGAIPADMASSAR